jgi:hypothetical protein
METHQVLGGKEVLAKTGDAVRKIVFVTVSNPLFRNEKQRTKFQISRLGIYALFPLEELNKLVRT